MESLLGLKCDGQMEFFRYHLHKRKQPGQSYTQRNEGQGIRPQGKFQAPNNAGEVDTVAKVQV